MNRKTLVGLAVTGQLLIGLAGCKPTLECGTWAFNGMPSGNSFPLSSASR